MFGLLAARFQRRRRCRVAMVLIDCRRASERGRRHESGLDMEGTQHAALFQFSEVGVEYDLGVMIVGINLEKSEVQKLAYSHS